MKQTVIKGAGMSEVCKICKGKGYIADYRVISICRECYEIDIEAIRRLLKQFFRKTDSGWTSKGYVKVREVMESEQ